MLDNTFTFEPARFEKAVICKKFAELDDNAEIKRSYFIEEYKKYNKPIDQSDRAFIWLLIFNIFPKIKKDFESHITQLVDDYFNIVKDFKLTDSFEFWPYAPNKDRFGGNYDDKSEIRVIFGDLERTRPILMLLPKNDEQDDFVITSEGSAFLKYVRKHFQRAYRVLYLISKLTSIGYIQGFSELYLVIYYVISNATELFGNNYDVSEALSFHIFSRLLTNKNYESMVKRIMSPNYIQSDSYRIFLELIQKYCADINNLIADENNIKYIALLRFAIALFGQNIDLAFNLQIFDSIFMHLNDIENYIISMSASLIIFNKDRINSDSDNPSKIINAYESGNIGDMIKFANKIYAETFLKKSD